MFNSPLSKRRKMTETEQKKNEKVIQDSVRRNKLMEDAQKVDWAYDSDDEKSTTMTISEKYAFQNPQMFMAFQMNFLVHELFYQTTFAVTLVKSKYHLMVKDMHPKDHTNLNQILEEMKGGLNTVNKAMYMNGKSTIFYSYEYPRQLCQFDPIFRYLIKIRIQGYKVGEKGIQSPVWQIVDAYKCIVD